MTKANRPVVRMKQGCSKRFKQGSPWVFSNEIDMTPDTKAIPAGTMVCLKDSNDTFLGVGSFNAHSLIAFRKFASDIETVVDAKFIAKKLRKAADLRRVLVNSPFYRLIHGEADGLPGLIIDRYDDIFACQLNTAGTDLLKQEILDALEAEFQPSCIVFRSETQARALEGLDPLNETAKGVLPDLVKLRENGIYFFADLKEGQKTGWFFDQRENRAFIARFAPAKRVADFYTYAGGFALHAAVGRAKEVVAVDRSEASLALAKKSAQENNVADKCKFIKADAFELLEKMNADKEKFGLVICDPPAFAKNRKDIGAGLRGYHKMAKLAAGLVEKEGFLALGSCSHHVTPDEFFAECTRGIFERGRTGRLIYQAGAGGDHPVHPQLPQSAYLKMLVFQLD